MMVVRVVETSQLVACNLDTLIASCDPKSEQTFSYPTSLARCSRRKGCSHRPDQNEMNENNMVCSHNTYLAFNKPASECVKT